MLVQDRAAEWFYLTLKANLEAGMLKPKIEAPDAGKKGCRPETMSRRILGRSAR